MYTAFLLEKKYLTRGTPIKRLVYTTQHGRKISLSCHRDIKLFQIHGLLYKCDPFHIA
jgi:hypothetical protein